MAEKYEKEWYRSLGGQVITEIINRAGIAVTTKYSPVEDGYSWESEGYSSGFSFSEPYEALMAFIAWSVQKGWDESPESKALKDTKDFLGRNYFVPKSQIFDFVHIENNINEEYVFVLDGVISDESYLTEDLAFLGAIHELIKENKRLERMLDNAIQEELGLE